MWLGGELKPSPAPSLQPGRPFSPGVAPGDYPLQVKGSWRYGQRRELDEPLVGSVPSYPQGKGEKALNKGERS